MSLFVLGELNIKTVFASLVLVKRHYVTSAVHSIGYFRRDLNALEAAQ